MISVVLHQVLFLSILCYGILILEEDCLFELTVISYLSYDTIG